MRILSREGNSPNTTVDVDGLSLDKMATRSTFIRMTSGLDEPVILMGGELVETADENLNIVAKAKMARPIPKKNSDNILIRLKMDY